MALVNWGFLHCMDLKKFFKNLSLRNCSSDFDIISQESGLTLADVRLLDLGCNCYRQTAFTICEHAGQIKFSVSYSQFRSLSPILVVFDL